MTARPDRPVGAPTLGSVIAVSDATIFAHYTDASGLLYWWVLEYGSNTDLALIMTNDSGLESERMYYDTIDNLLKTPDIEPSDEHLGMTVAEAREALPAVDYGNTYYGRGSR